MVEGQLTLHVILYRAKIPNGKTPIGALLMSYLYYAFNNVSEASSVSQVGYNLEGDRVWKVEKAPKGVN